MGFTRVCRTLESRTYYTELTSPELVISVPATSVRSGPTQVLKRIPLPAGSLPKDYSLAVPKSYLDQPATQVRYDICEAGGVPVYPYSYYPQAGSSSAPSPFGGSPGLSPCLEALNAPTGSNGQYILSINYTTGSRLNGGSPSCDSYMSSPLVLDLQMDGIRTLPAEAGTRFDIDGVGHMARVGWIAPGDDAFLVLDLNHKGRIDSGAEQFGNATRLPNGNLASNGFEALAQYDVDKNGRIDPKDPVYSQLGLWLDANSDGESQGTEISSLSSQQIEFISVEHIEVAEIDGNGNQTLQRSYFQKPSVFGKNIGIIADIWFKVLE
jgi:hypothetical protein